MEAIYAIDSKNGLSKNGKIPWNSKKDLKFFTEKTKYNVIIMGKKTYLSLPNRPLKNRLNIVLTSNPNDSIFDEPKNLNNLIVTNNEKIYNSILNYREKWLNIAPYLDKDFTIFFIGGKNIYDKFIPLCKTVWVTKIKNNYLCDLFINYDFSKEFTEKCIEEDEELQIILYEKIHYKIHKKIV
jgi:dihydrofolate reductase